MNKQNDPLSHLWQSQPVQTIEPEELKALWQKNRTKQWRFIVYDLVGVIAAIIMCVYFFREGVNLFKQIWVGSFTVMAIVLTPFVISLRYRSLGSGISTNEYLERLIQQKINNIRIVRLSAWLWIFVCVAYGLWSTAYYLYYQPSANTYFFNVMRSSSVMLVLTIFMAMWGKSEMRKNNEELERFSNVTQ